MLDHIGTSRIGIRKGTGDGEVIISKLGTSERLHLSPAEWYDLSKLVTALTASVDFDLEYSPKG